MNCRIALVALLWIATATAQAEMYVDRSIVTFEPGEPSREDVEVSNTGDDVMYVQVEVLRVDNPGTPDEERVKVSNPQDLKLLATPSKLIIPPGSRKLIRIVNLQSSNERERIYRINVRPIVPPLEEETSQLRIVVAYQILTIVQPDEPETNLSVTRDGTTITFENSGNSNVLLSDGRQCKTDTEEECQELTSRRLYAGNTWELSLPYDAPVSYSVRTYDGIRNEVFP